MKELTDKITVQDFLCAGTVLHSQALNFQIMANGRVQKMDPNLDKTKVKYFKLRKVFDKEQLKQVTTDSILASAKANLKKARAEIELNF